jgi:uncharacterized protein (TIGR02271 family)
VITTDETREIISSSVYDSTGKKIGSVGQVYLDIDTGQPEWLTVKTGLFGTKESFVPLARAHVRPDHDVELEVDKAAVTQAPNFDTDRDLSPEDEMRLYQHYGMTYGEQAYGEQAESARTSARRDDAMTRSEERMRVGTTTKPVGRARLRKYVVTEQVQQTVPVSHEEVRVEREPITDANREAAMSGPDITEAEHEVTLHAETPEVQKETVPVERVRLGTEEVTEEETVSGEVRKEKIETEEDIPERPRKRPRT